jgi:hypothetical protein
MAVESTLDHGGTGKPGSSGRPEGIPDDEWSAGETSHKELMKLDDSVAATVSRNATPAPPGEIDPPPPDKEAKAGASTGTKASAPDARPTQTAQGQDKTSSNSGPATESQANRAPAAPARPTSQAKVKVQESLPALADDAEIGREKEQTVPRDGKADLGFTGTLLGSAASSAPKGMWQELRIYSTASGKHVFSKVTRTIFAEDNDKHEADVFEPSPTSVPSQLLRSAREMARSRPMTWMDAAVAFFGYDQLAKVLYRKLSVDFEERI